MGGIFSSAPKRCKVKDCTQNHSAHFCKTCKSNDSNHFSSNCPMTVAPQYLSTNNNYQTTNFGGAKNGVNKCKVNGCQQQHANHFCKNCKNSDSDHFAKNCNQFNQSSYYSVEASHQRFRSKTMNNRYQNPLISSQKKQKDELQEFKQMLQVIQILKELNPEMVDHMNKNRNSNLNSNGDQDDSDSSNDAIECKVKNHNLFHQSRQCRFCKQKNVNHFQDQCPLQKAKEQKIINERKAQYAQDKKMSCKVQGCIQSHLHHYCYNCQKTDSDHRSKDCPTLAGKNILHCRVPLCGINHNSHHCKICGTQDSDHFARDCEKGQIVYHGTTQDCAKAIQKSKMLPGKYGNLGPGIYFTNVKQAAVGIAKYRQAQQKNGKKQRSVIIQARIFKKEGCYKQRIHGPWKNAYEKDFPEIAVTDDSCLRVITYEYV